MYLTTLRSLTVFVKGLRILNKKFGFEDIGRSDVFCLYLVYKSHEMGENITTYRIRKYMKNNGHGSSVGSVSNRLLSYERKGLLTSEYVERKLPNGWDCSHKVYSVTPLLVQYLGALEKQIKRTRWDW